MHEVFKVVRELVNGTLVSAVADQEWRREYRVGTVTFSETPLFVFEGELEAIIFANNVGHGAKVYKCSAESITVAPTWVSFRQEFWADFWKHMPIYQSPNTSPVFTYSLPPGTVLAQGVTLLWEMEYE